MPAQELFASLPSAQKHDILTWLHEQNRAASKAYVGLLATRRKLRPVFIERKPREERLAWMSEALTKPANEDLAAEILQTYILQGHEKLVCDFLDVLQISHDGKGLVDMLPAEPPSEAIDKAVDKLLATHAPGAVRLYLHLFVQMDIADWPYLKNLLEQDTRLHLAQMP